MREIALMFSGGLDSTYSAVQLLDKCQRVHLLTFDSGYMLGARYFSQKSARRLIERYGDDHFVHHVLSTRDFLRIQFRDAWRYVRSFHSPLVLCASCQLAMDVATVCYCLENHVSWATDGKSASQTETCFQTLEHCGTIQRFMARYGVRYLLPPYHGVSRDMKRRFLRSQGLFDGQPLLTALQKTGLNNFSDFLGRQPLCALAVGQFVLTSPLRHVPPFRNAAISLESAEAYQRIREPLAQAFLEEHFRALGATLRDYVSALPPAARTCTCDDTGKPAWCGPDPLAPASKDWNPGKGPADVPGRRIGEPGRHRALGRERCWPELTWNCDGRGGQGAEKGQQRGHVAPWSKVGDHVPPPGVAETVRQVPVCLQACHGPGQCLGIIGRHREAGHAILEPLPYPPHVGGDHGSPVAQCLGAHQAEGLGRAARGDHRAGALVGLAQLRCAHLPREGDAVAHPQLVCQGAVAGLEAARAEDEHAGGRCE